MSTGVLLEKPKSFTALVWSAWNVLKFQGTIFPLGMFLSVIFPGLRRKPTTEVNVESQKVVFPAQIEFFLSTLGFAVGFGNVWRFPSLVYRFSGIFLVPYVFCLVCFGLPITYLHLILGQYSGQPTSHVFGMLSPVFSGVGWALLVVMIPLCTYYNCIVAWSLYYLSESIYSPVPWSKEINCATDNATLWWMTEADCDKWQSSPQRALLSAEYYLKGRILHNIGNYTTGGLVDLQPKMFTMMIGAWLLTFFGVSKGLKSMAKCVYITATFPYIVLVVLLVFGCTLPGAWELGIKYHMNPDFSKLTAEPEIWTEAAFMVFYSLGLDSGTLISLASYSRFHNNIYRDAILLVVLDTATSILAGVVAFAFAGYMAHIGQTDSASPSVDRSDQLFLSFVVYPASFAQMDAPWLWSLLFFSMILFAAIDCEFAWIEQVTAALNRMWPSTAQHETRVTFALCVLFFILGIPLSSTAGVYVFRLFDDFTVHFNAIILNFIQVLLIGWIYGTEKLFANIDEMSNDHTDPVLPIDPEMEDRRTLIQKNFGPKGSYVAFSWKYLCPVVLLGLLGFGIVNYSARTFDNVVFPKPLECFGWFMMVAPLSFIPIMACYQIYKTVKRKGCNHEALKELFQPTEQWQEIACEDPAHLQVAAETLLRRRSQYQSTSSEPVLSTMRRHTSGSGSNLLVHRTNAVFTVEPMAKPYAQNGDLISNSAKLKWDPSRKDTNPSLTQPNTDGVWGPAMLNAHRSVSLATNSSVPPVRHLAATVAQSFELDVLHSDPNFRAIGFKRYVQSNLSSDTMPAAAVMSAATEIARSNEDSRSSPVFVVESSSSSSFRERSQTATPTVDTELHSTNSGFANTGDVSVKSTAAVSNGYLTSNTTGTGQPGFSARDSSFARVPTSVENSKKTFVLEAIPGQPNLRR